MTELFFPFVFTCFENEAKTKLRDMTTAPINAVGRYPNRSATKPDKKPAMYVMALPVVPTNAMEDGVESGKMN